MKRLGIIVMSAMILTGVAGLAVILDFSGTYEKLPTTKDPWCGRSIELKKLRFNKYRISWELLTGEITVADFAGKHEGDTLDFRSKGYGYTYTLSDNKNRLIVTLAVPNRTVVCEFARVHGKK
ncbi:MAG: hypothetical protein JW838_00370 [Spirochaetes bacterium]|nr:hypothetical protein [Spirochaetota bacterium]